MRVRCLLHRCLAQSSEQLFAAFCWTVRTPFPAHTLMTSITTTQARARHPADATGHQIGPIFSTTNHTSSPSLIHVIARLSLPKQAMLVLRRTSSSSTRTSSGSSSRLLQQRWPWGQHQQPRPHVPLAAVALSSSASGVYHSPHDHPLLQACRSSTHTFPRLPLSSSSSTRFSTNSASVGDHL